MMDPTILNTHVITAIKKILPENTNLSHFLSDLLFLNKGAIYRRLRGEIPFSFGEIYAIAQKLGVSLDYLAKSANKEINHFELIFQQFQSEKNDTPQSLSRFEQLLGNILSDTSSKFELSHNLFPQVPAHMFYHLSKYNSFKWVYKNNMHHPIPFKKIDYPQEIFEMHKRNNMATTNIKETSYIWDDTIIEMLVREINFFSKIKLLDNEDVATLKKELYEWLNYVEELTINGVFPTGNKINIYISAINSDAAYSYMESTRFRTCIIGVFDLHYLISTDEQAFERMKEKIISLKRGATLITGSNEIYRTSFFIKQRELIDRL